MKKNYLAPEVLPIILYPADGVLNNASNEKFKIVDGEDLFSSGVMELF